MAAHVAEGVAGVRAECADGRDADDDNQGQHDGVFDRRWPFLLGYEADQGIGELIMRPQAQVRLQRITGRRRRLRLAYAVTGNPVACCSTEG